MIELLELCLVLDTSFALQPDRLIRLDRYAVRYRYPSEMADKDEARLAFRATKEVRTFMWEKLGIADDQVK